MTADQHQARDDRARFRATMTFGAPDRLPLWECAFWGETLERWVAEGLPAAVAHPDGPERGPTEASLRAGFGFDRSFGVYFRDTVRVNIDLCPGFTPAVLAEEDGIITERGADGVISRWSRDGHSTRQFVRFPVETRDDFRRLLPQLQPETPARFAEGWAARARALQAAGAPICLRAGGYFGFARSLMGLENLSYAFHDQPALVEEIFAHRTAYLLPLLETVLQQVTPDFAEFWEDMAYKTGPLVSPTLYRALAVRHYRAVTDLLRRYGVDVVLLDSDGNVDELIPVWLEGGITALWPLEAAAGMDPVAVRARYGRDLALIGGIDKRALARDPAAIEEEVRAKVLPLLATGGFIPTCDHAVPPDVPLANYRHYLRLLRQLAGAGEAEVSGTDYETWP